MRCFVLFLVITAWLATSSVAQTSTPSGISPAGNDAQTAAIVAKVLAVFASGPIHSVQLSGTVTGYAGAVQESGTFTLQSEATGVSTLQINLNQLSRTESTGSFSDGPACSWAGPEGVQHASADHNCRRALNWMLPLLALQTRSTALQATLSSFAEASGAASQKLEFVNAITTKNPKTSALLSHLSATTIVVDANSLLPSQLISTIHPDNAENIDIPASMSYGDYRRIDGAMLPFHIQRYINNGLAYDFTVQTAVVQ